MTLEKKLIDMNTSVELSSKKLKDSQKEIELLNGKIKILTNEKAKICNMFDAKVGDTLNVDIIFLDFVNILPMNF